MSLSTYSTAGSRAAAAAYGGGRNQYSTMPIMGGGSGNGGGAGSVDKLVLEAGVNHDNSGMNFYQTTTLSTFSKRGTEQQKKIQSGQSYLFTLMAQLS